MATSAMYDLGYELAAAQLERQKFAPGSDDYYRAHSREHDILGQISDAGGFGGEPDAQQGYNDGLAAIS